MQRLRNLGPASARMLQAAGLGTLADLRARGAVQAWADARRIALLAGRTPPSLNLLWAIEGALTNRDWQDVARDDRTRLLMQLDDLERAG